MITFLFFNIRFADQLAELNPNASDEMVFQHARHITIAEYQHIVYSEYLPEVLGSDLMSRFSLFYSGKLYLIAL